MLRACVVRTTLIAPEEAMYGKGPTRSWLEPQSIPEAGYVELNAQLDF